MPELERVAAVRELLPATRAGIYLNAGACGPIPAESQRAMDEQTALELTTGRALAEQWEDALARMEEARAAVAAVMIADPADIALTHSTSDGLNLVISSLAWQPGDRVVTTNQEHPGGLGPLLALRARLGVEVERVDVGDGDDPDRVVAAFETALARPARAIMVSHALWTTGAVLPVARLGALARTAGAASVVDGAQAAGAIPVVLDDLGVDAYAMPAKKWLLGPEGMGALWVRRALADATVPALAGSLSYREFSFEAPVLHPGARRFEATDFHRPSVVGFARSLGWLSMFVGVPWAQERAVRLARGMADRLSAIPGVSVVTPRPVAGTLVSFRIAGWTAAQALAEVAPRALAILCDVPAIDALRLSIGFWTTEAELDRMAEVVEQVAQHAPGTLPQRRLTVLGSDGQPLA
jgi:selenocysteine lyase/cysteine desulfurase